MAEILAWGPDHTRDRIACLGPTRSGFSLSGSGREPVTVESTKQEARPFTLDSRASANLGG
jgi:hypothetical protein